MKDLISLEKKLASDLEAVRKALSVLKGRSLLPGDERVPSAGRKTAKVKERKEKKEKKEKKKSVPYVKKNNPTEVAAAAEKYFRHVHNKPSNTSEINKYVGEHGLKIEGKNIGAAIAAALRSDKEKRFVLADKKNKLWALKE
ncbi:MAG: hypothetical protein FJX34_02385 [Alphaproteobacteria bacterium]|nr:hypothetical protein [Alphaproteobacteria bacterium]